MSTLADRLIPDAVADAALDLWRSGATAETVHKAIWPQGEPSVPPHVLQSLLEAMDVQRACALPADDLPPVLAEAQEQLTAARAELVTAIGDDPTNGALQAALSKNVQTALNVERFRLDRQTHRHNLNQLRERARNAALDASGIRPGGRDPFPTMARRPAAS